MAEEPFDVVLRDVRIRRRPGGPVHVGIRNGCIDAITVEPIRGRVQLEGEGNLLAPSFVDAHLHLDKVYTVSMVGDDALQRYASGTMEQAMSAIELAAAIKARCSEAWIYANARRAVLEGLRHGVTHVLAFADTDTKARLEGVRAMLRLRGELREIVDLRVVAFPQEGLLRDPGAEDYVREALELGADVVGGIPWIEHTDREAEEHVERMMSLASAYDRDVAMLTDDAGDPTLRTTEMLAQAAIRHGRIGRVVACHARAMALYPEPYFRRLVALARRAGMAFVSAPHTGPLHLRIEALLEAGLPVALGQDDIADAYYPYGRHNLLEVAFIASHLIGAPTFNQMEMLLDLVTTQAARVLRIADHDVDIGAAADLVLLHGSDAREVLTMHAPPRYVLRRGRVVAETSEETRYPVLGV
jgi:cytosine deaminase